MASLPSIENLRCFEAASRSKSFRAAAREVGLTPAAFGQRIRQLEEELGSQLFHRTTRSIRLTASGVALVPQAREVLIAASACARVVHGESVTPLTLLVGTRFELGLSWLLPIVEPLEAELRQLRLQFYFGSGPDLLQRLRQGELDCVVTSARLPDPGFDGEVLEPETYAFVGAASLLEARPFRRRRDAARHVLLDVDASLPLYRYLRDAPGLRGPMQFADQRLLGLGEAVRRWVLAGRGVAVLPEYMIRDELEAGELEPIMGGITLLHDHFRLVFRADDVRRERLSELADGLRRFPIRGE